MRIPAPTPRALLLATALLTAPALAGDIYFVDIFVPDIQVDGSIRRIGTDGTGLTTLVETGRGLRSLDVDPIAGKIYWTDVDNFVIRRSDLDGGNIEDVVNSGLIFPAAIDVVPSLDKMYWLDQDASVGNANLDGSGSGVLIDSVTHRGVAVDVDAGKIYWSTSIDRFRGQIRRANLDGTQQEIVVSTGLPEFKPSAIAIDPAGGKIYWTDYVVDVVQRANLADGSDIEFLWAAGANHNPRGIALDLSEGKIYWGQDIDFDGTGGRIMRMDLNGSNPEIFLDGVGLVNYLAIVESGACVADWNGDGAVDTRDVLAFLNAWTAGGQDADVNGDGVVDTRDVTAFLNAWNAGCP
ncbi:MAG TPA: GC-type dockerin domain-anchored protein [Phycisphaerales bacterium]|nr:GC-type dockerin domain-anchored protein [Phycisphaerales bacterium]